MSVLNTRSAATAATLPDPACLVVPLGANASIVVSPNGRGPASAAVTGELDIACAHGLTAALRSALDRHAWGVMLDLSGVEFFDCAALHALERARHHAERVGRTLTLERSSPAVDLVLRLTEAPWPNEAGPGDEPDR